MVSTATLPTSTHDCGVTRGTTPSSTNQKDTVGPTAPAKTHIWSKPAEKLEAYAGQGASLDTFFIKFEGRSAYLGWTEQYRLFQLQNSLAGTAATFLWAGGKQARSTELLQMLKDQRGSDNKSEQFWIELRVEYDDRRVNPYRHCIKIKDGYRSIHNSIQ